MINKPAVDLWITSRRMIASYPQDLSPVGTELQACHSAGCGPGQRHRVATMKPAMMNPKPISTFARSGRSFISGMLLPAR